MFCALRVDVVVCLCWVPDASADKGIAIDKAVPLLLANYVLRPCRLL